MPQLTNPGNENDEVLVSAILKRDTQAFRKLIIRYEKLVVSIVFKMITRREDGEDICQDIFLKVYEQLKNFRFQSKLSTWIGSIAFNTCINFLKKHKPLFLEDLKGSGDDTDDQKELIIEDQSSGADVRLLLKDEQSFLLKSIADLSVIQRTVLYLFHHNDLSLQEISEITNLPVSTVKSHLFRARKQLREKMNR